MRRMLGSTAALASGALLLSWAAGCDPASFEGYCLGADGGCTDASADQGGGWGGYAGQGGYGWGGTSQGGYAGDPGQCSGACSASCGDCNNDGYCETLLLNNPMHCGHCNRACSDCNQGVCGTQAIAAEQAAYGEDELAVGGGYVYYAVGTYAGSYYQYNIKRVPVTTTGIPELVASGVMSQIGTLSLWATDSTVYWATTYAGAVAANHATPSQLVTLVSAGGTGLGPVAITANASGKTCIVSMVSPGMLQLQGPTGSASFPTTTAPAQVAAVALDASGACYVATAEGQLEVLGMTGQLSTVVEGKVTAIAFAPGMNFPHFYVNTVAGSPTLFVATGNSHVQLDYAASRPLAAYGDRVFYASADGTIVMSGTQLPGSSAAIGYSLGVARAMRVDATHVYWTTNTQPGSPSGILQVNRTVR